MFQEFENILDEIRKAKTQHTPVTEETWLSWKTALYHAHPNNIYKKPGVDGNNFRYRYALLQWYYLKAMLFMLDSPFKDIKKSQFILKNAINQLIPYNECLLEELSESEIISFVDLGINALQHLYDKEQELIQAGEPRIISVTQLTQLLYKVFDCTISLKKLHGKYYFPQTWNETVPHWMSLLSLSIQQHSNKTLFIANELKVIYSRFLNALPPLEAVVNSQESVSAKIFNFYELQLLILMADKAARGNSLSIILDIIKNLNLLNELQEKTEPLVTSIFTQKDIEHYQEQLNLLFLVEEKSPLKEPLEEKELSIPSPLRPNAPPHALRTVSPIHPPLTPRRCHT